MLDICLSLSLSLSVLQSLMFSSQWYSSSQTTSGGTSPVSLHVMEWSEDAIFSAKVFFRKVGQEHEDFWKDRMTERHRGGEEMKCVNKRVSIIFVTFCFVCLRDNYHSCTRRLVYWKKIDSRHEDKLFLFVISSLVPLLYIHTYIHHCLCPIQLDTTPFKGDL